MGDASICLLREKPLSVPSTLGGALGSALKCSIYSLSLPGRAGVPIPWHLRPAVLAHVVQKHTHCPGTLTALFTASHWCLYQTLFLVPTTWCLSSLRSHPPFPLPTQVPEALAAPILVPAAALLPFNSCQQGRVPGWWCLIPWEPPRAMRTLPGDGSGPWGVC